MKLVVDGLEQMLMFAEGYATELVIENKKMFLEIVKSFVTQIEGSTQGKVTLSVGDKPVELSRYADITVQFAPFELNRKNLLTKLCNALEQQALSPLHYLETGELVKDLELFVDALAEELPFEVECQRATIGPILRAMAPQITETNKGTLERILDYMEIVRELDRDRLFVMVNMRTYFCDEQMASFLKSACSHDFKILMLESISFSHLPNVKRYTVDEDLCEF